MNRLNESKPGENVEIIEIRAGMGLRNRLASMGLFRGSKIKIISNSFKGPVIVAKNGTRFGIGFGASNKIYVKTLNKTDEID